MSEYDDLASAALDGALDPDERARAETDPEVAERRATFGSIADALRADDAASTGRPDELTRRRHLRAALDEFDALHGTATVAAAASTPEPAGESAVVADVVAFNRPDRRRRPLGALLAAAAVVIVVGAVVPVVLNGSDDGDDTAAVALDAVDDSADAAFDEATEDAGTQARRAEESIEAEAMTEMADDAMEDDDAAEEAMEESVAEEEEEEETDLAEAEVAADDAAEAAGLAPIIPYDPEFREETIDELLFRVESGDPGRPPVCTPPDGLELLHVADGFDLADDTTLELHLVASPDGGVDLVVFAAETCEIR